MTKNATKALLCGALLASVLPAIEQTASADPGTLGLETNVTGDADNEFSHFTGFSHSFGGATILPYDSAFYSIIVTSGLSNRAGWQYEITFDYINFGISFFQNSASFTNPAAEVHVTVDDPDGIGSYTVKGYDGSAIAWTEGADHNLGNGVFHILVLLDEVEAGDYGFTIQWNAVPAPGALALLGVAGVVGKRRRRN